MAYKDVTPPAGGKISIQNGKLNVPDHPDHPVHSRATAPGPDIWAASVRVFDAAVDKAYGGQRKISWFEVFAGEESFKKFNNWLPDDTVEAFKEYLVGIKGPLTTPVGGGIRSLNVALRQMLDLYVCLRPVQWFSGVPSPVKHPEKVNMVIFRENTEDIYAGIDYEAGSHEAQKIIEFIKTRVPEGFQEDPLWQGRRRLGRHRHQAGQSSRARERLVRAGHRVRHRQQAQERHDCPQGQHHEVHRRRVPRLGLRVGQTRVRRGGNRRRPVVQDSRRQARRRHRHQRRHCRHHAPAGAHAPEDFDVIATLNLNGDYLSDALAAQVGGIGIAPGGNINYVSGHAIFEATHGTAPKYANKDGSTPAAWSCRGEMMFRYLGWTEAADLILKGLNGAIGSKRVTYDFARLMDGATEIKCSAVRR